MTKTVALLPMKANSERVPGKNFKNFAGKPLFRWILDRLLAVPAIDLIVINTDARSKLAESGLVGSERILIRDRAPEICGDYVSMNKVIANDIANVSAETYLMTHTTNPLLSSKSISNALQQYRTGVTDNTLDSLFAVNKIQTRFYREDGSPVNHDPNVLVRTQDLEPWFEENSNLYIFSKESFDATHARIGLRPSMFVTSKTESLDIDEPEDWDIAAAVAGYRER